MFIIQRYDALLVVLSVLIACVASYAALTLMHDRQALSGRQDRWSWPWLGAAPLGLGIWTMHFVGMLALSMPVSLGYRPGLTLLSLGLAFGTSALALRLLGPVWPSSGPVTSNGPGTARRWAWLGSGTVLGLGIVGMHALGMAAIVGPVRVQYSPWGVVASAVVAVGIASAALWLASAPRDPRRGAARGPRLLPALVLGLAIAAMHYTGMAAAHFSVDHSQLGSALRPIPGGRLLALWVGGTVLGGLGLLVAALQVGRFLDRRTRQLQEAMRLARSNNDALSLSIRSSEQQYATVVNALQEAVLLLDAEGYVLTANGSAARLFGHSPQDMVGRSLNEIGPGVTDERGRELPHNERPSARAYRHGEAVRHKLIGWRGGEAMRWFTINTQPLESGGAVVSLYDVTNVHEHETRLRFQANHDELTGLVNRRQFRAYLGEEMYAAFWIREQVAVLFLDLDHFKDVNDELGHSVGDSLLRQVAERMRSVLPPGVLLARFGGDEFGLILSGIKTGEAAQALAEHLIESLRTPFPVGDRALYIGVSVGISLYPEDAHDEETLLKYADLALYQVKAQGRGGALRFDRRMAEQQAKRVQLEQSLREAVTRGELSLVYQPLIDLQSGQVQSCEALLRWTHPELGAVSPRDFVPLAEESGLIDRLGRWVVDQACAQGRAWMDQGLPLRIAVNISPRQFRRSTVTELVTQALEREGLPASLLCVEVTESALMDDSLTVREQLEALRALGVTVALDDFGTGYSSLGWLQELPLDKLKLDRAFVSRLDSDERQALVVGSVVALARGLGLIVVAEGIETQAQYDRLAALGAHLGQGFLMSRPLSAEQMTEFIRARRPQREPSR